MADLQSIRGKAVELLSEVDAAIATSGTTPTPPTPPPPTNPLVETINFGGLTWALDKTTVRPNGTDFAVKVGNPGGTLWFSAFGYGLGLWTDGVALYGYSADGGGTWWKWLTTAWNAWATLASDPRPAGSVVLPVNGSGTPPTGGGTTPTTPPTTPPSTPPLASHDLSTLKPNVARNLGTYAPDNPDAGLYAVEPNELDDSRMLLDFTGDTALAGDGGHGPSQQPTIIGINLNPAKPDCLVPRNIFAPMPVADMVRANLDTEYGRWKSTNYPAARHWYDLVFVDEDGWLHVLQPRAMPDHLNDIISTTDWDGRIYKRRLASGEVVYSEKWGTHQDHPDVPFPPGVQAVPYSFMSQGLYDPKSKRFVIIDKKIVIYDPKTMDFTVGPDTGFGPGAACAEYCPDNDKGYVLSGNYATNAQGLTEARSDIFEVTLPRLADGATIDLANCKMTRKAPSGTVPSFKWSKREGMCWHPNLRRFVGPCVGGLLYSYDPIGNAWSSVLLATEQPLDGTSPVQNYFHSIIYNRFGDCVMFPDDPDYQTGAPRLWAVKPSFDGAGAGGQPAPTGNPTTTPANAPASATLDLGNGNVAHYQFTGLTSSARYVGEHVQQDRFIAARDPKFPAWQVALGVDVDGSRCEVNVHYGRKTIADPDLVSTPLTLTVYDAAGGIVGSTQAPRAWRWGRFRWESKPRPLARTVAELVTRGWLPKFGKDGMFGQGANPVDFTWPGPFAAMPSAWFDPVMADGGDHDQIGLLTEAAASYCIFGDDASLRTLRAEAEQSGNWAIHIVNDDGTMPVFNTLDVSSFQLEYGGPVQDFPNLSPSTTPGYTAFEEAHAYASINLAAMLTDDPWLIEALQHSINAKLLINRTVKVYAQLGGLMDPQQTRAMAWGVRDLVHCYVAMPDTPTPSWLASKAYIKSCLDDTRTYLMRYVNSPARIHKVFRCCTRSDIDAPWMATWLTCTAGLAVAAGLTEWRPVFEWLVGKQIAFTDGKSGWDRRWCAAYRFCVIKNDTAWHEFTFLPYTDTTIDASTCTDWKDAFNFYAAGQNWPTRSLIAHGIGTSDDTGHLIFPATWTDPNRLYGQDYDTSAAAFANGQPGNFAGYPSYYLFLRAALSLATQLVVPGAADCYSWLQAQLVTTFAHYGSRGGPVTGQARFSV